MEKLMIEINNETTNPPLSFDLGGFIVIVNCPAHPILSADYLALVALIPNKDNYCTHRFHLPFCTLDMKPLRSWC